MNERVVEDAVGDIGAGVEVNDTHLLLLLLL